MVVGGRRSGIEGRRRRRGRLPRLLLTAGLLSLLALAVGSIVNGSAEGPDPAIAFADQVRPAVDLSTRQSATFDDLRAQVGTLDRDGLRLGVNRLVRESHSALVSVENVDPNDRLRAAHGLIVTCLTTRSRALAAFSATLGGAFEGEPPERAVQSVVDVGRDLAVSDRAYQLFLEALPAAARGTMPASTWVADETRYARPEVAALVATLRAGASLAPVHDLSVLTVSVDPSPVGAEPPHLVLPTAKTLKLQIVVANAGSVAQKRVPLQAVVSSEGGIDTGRQFVDLAPGQRATVAVSLRPSPGGALTLKVTIGPVADEGSVADNEQTSTYVMR